jgi:hypothetical protein
VPDALEELDSVPHVAPLQPLPDRAQVTPLFCESFCTVPVNRCEAPLCTLALVGVTVTTISAGAAVTVIVAVADFVVSATDVAVKVTVAGEGTLDGAVYVMAVPDALEEADSAPHDEPLQPAPESDQVTPLPELSLLTVDVNDCPWLTCTEALVGERLTAIDAPEGPVLSEVELDEQPHRNAAARIVTAQKHSETRSAKARVTDKVLPSLDFWICELPRFSGGRSRSNFQVLGQRPTVNGPKLCGFPKVTRARRDMPAKTRRKH